MITMFNGSTAIFNVGHKQAASYWPKISAVQDIERLRTKCSVLSSTEILVKSHNDGQEVFVQCACQYSVVLTVPHWFRSKSVFS